MSKLRESLIIVTLFLGAVAVYVKFEDINQRTDGILKQKPILIEDVIPSVIDNVVHVKNNTGQWQGSGVLIAPDLVLTARHVAETGEDFTITTNDGKQYKAERAISSKKYDLGFIKLQEPVKCTTRFGSIDDCKLGQPVFAIGSPFGDMNMNSVTAGIISSKARTLEDYGCPKSYGWSISFQTDAAGHPGNSGCPVYTLDGIVRGILVGGWSNALIYCIPTELVANDCRVIQLMFLMDTYQYEKASAYEPDDDPYYNEAEDNEYY
uniref:Putative trypsin-like peptidase domain containing protein n=1 Tax=viral metagenome TaxID=1070528 RepID=A0A6M3IFZ3_9ZZZZ